MFKLVIPALIATWVLAIGNAYGQELFSIKCHGATFFDIAFSTDGRKVITRGRENLERTSKVWDLETRKPLKTFDGMRAGSPCFPQFSPSGGSFFCLFAKRVSPTGGKTILTPGWEVHENDIKTGANKVLHKWEGDMAPVALWMDQKMAVTATKVAGDPKSLALEFFDLDAKKSHVLPVGEPFEALSFSADRKRVVLKFHPGLVKVIDWKSGKKTAEINTVGDPLNERLHACFLLPDGRSMVSVTSFSECLRVWDLQTGKMTKSVQLRGRADCPSQLSPDGRLIATFGGGGVCFFDTKTHKYIAEVGDDDNTNFEVVRFAPDGKTFAVGDSDGRLQFFKTPNVEP